jgi:hypothetical protein
MIEKLITFFISYKKWIYPGYIPRVSTYPGGIRPHDPLVQSPQWQAETMPLDHAARTSQRLVVLHPADKT